MILSVMKPRIFAFCALTLGAALACAALPAAGQKRPQEQVKPMAGPRATVLRDHFALYFARHRLAAS